MLSGLGTIGKNSLFIHSVYGAGVRLGTLFTDCPLTQSTIDECIQNITASGCEKCDLCVNSLPRQGDKGRRMAPWN